MTDLSALDLAIEAIARMPDGTSDDRGEATRRLLLMRDCLPSLTESIAILQAQRDAAQATIADCQGKNRFLLDTVIAGINEDVKVAREERNQERERANEWLSLLIDLRNTATWAGNGTAPAEELQAVLARVDAALVRS